MTAIITLAAIFLVQVPSSKSQSQDATQSLPQGNADVSSEVAPLFQEKPDPPDNNGIAPEPDAWKQYPSIPDVKPVNEPMDPLVIFKPVAKDLGAHGARVEWAPPRDIDDNAKKGVTYELQSRNPVRVPSGDLEWKTIYKGKDTSFDVSGLQSDNDYQFRVIPSSINKRIGVPSNTLGIETLGEPYGLPDDYPLKITTVGPDFVALKWETPTGNLTRADIFDVHCRVQQAGARQLDGFEMDKDAWKLSASASNLPNSLEVHFLKSQVTYSFKVSVRGKTAAFPPLVTSATTIKGPPIKRPVLPKAPPKPDPDPLKLKMPAPLKEMPPILGELKTYPLPAVPPTNYAKSPDTN